MPLLHKDLPVISFTDSQAFYDWLAQNHTQTTGFWLRYFKKASGVKTIVHTDAVDMALCWGWIDGLINKYDEISYVVRFTPRRPKSIWSKVNVAKVERLISENLMKPPGLKLVEEAKSDGRLDAAYEGQGHMKVPQDFIELLKENKPAYDFFLTLDKANLHAISFRLSTTLDKEKRAKKMQQILIKLHNNVHFHNQKK
jgi:uncharacterized protein YdeI (YjbR/CyaY-like superfamily)